MRNAYECFKNKIEGVSSVRFHLHALLSSYDAHHAVAHPLIMITPDDVATPTGYVLSIPSSTPSGYNPKEKKPMKTIRKRM